MTPEAGSLRTARAPSPVADRMAKRRAPRERASVLTKPSACVSVEDVSARDMAWREHHCQASVSDAAP